MRCFLLSLLIFTLLLQVGNVHAFERTKRMDQLCEKLANKHGSWSGRMNEVAKPKAGRWLLKRVEEPSWWSKATDDYPVIEYIFKQNTSDGFTHHLSCKLEENGSPEIRVNIPEWGWALVCSYLDDDGGC